MAKQASGAPVTKKKKKVHVDTNGKAFVKATFNNVIVTLTDTYGNVIAWSSAGRNGFKGSRKNTPFAAQVSAEAAAKEAHDLGNELADIFICPVCGHPDAACCAECPVGGLTARPEAALRSTHAPL